MSFDPYQKWLGIGPRERPPTLYRLVGVADFESDGEAIHQSALARIASLRKRQAGTHGELTQALMNEVSQARLALLDPERKAEYDRQLKAELDARPGAPVARSGNGTAVIMAAAAIVLLLVAGTAYLMLGPGRAPTGERAEGANQSVAAEPVKKAEAAIEPETVEKSPKPDGGSAKSSVTEKPKPKVPVKPTPDAAPAGKAGYLAIKKLEPDVLALKLEPGTVVPLVELNGPAHETHPSLASPDETQLFFWRADRGAELWHVGIRKTKEERFTGEGRWAGMELASGKGLAWTADGLGAFAASAAKPGALVSLRRSQLAAAIGVGGEAPDVGGANAAGCLAAGDGELYFSRMIENEPNLFVAKREKPEGRFSAGVSVGFPSGFVNPTVTADGKTMYLQGHSGDKRPQIYRSQRSVDGKWGKPAPLPESRGLAKDGRSFEMTPCISRDGSTLFFASDRLGGAGGFDLWVMRLAPDDVSAEPAAKGEPKVATKPSMKEKDAKAAPKKVVKAPPPATTPISGPLENWMTLGPIASPAELGLAELKQRIPDGLLRRFPKAGEGVRGTKVEWKRAGTPKEVGAYVLTLQFRSKTRLNLQVTIDSAPGAAAIQVDKPQQAIEVGATEPWKAWPVAGAKGEPIDLLPGRHRLVAVVCVGEPATPLVVRLLDADTGKPAEGLAAED